MCGIAGIFGSSATPESLLVMLSAIEHRGDPEYFGEIMSGSGVALGTNRLAIVDPEHGAQPFYSSNGNVCAINNGQIYNHAELKVLLEAHHTFQTHCDTEVIAPSWIKWGDRFVERLRGMFGLAVFDQSNKNWLIARDPLGIKPMYYSISKGSLFFASELKALVALDQLKEIKILEPGTFLSPSGVFSYCNIPNFSQENSTDAILVNNVKAKLEEAVRIRLPNPRQKVAVLLSGGIDSSIILLLTRKLHKGPVEAFTIFNSTSSSDDLESAVTLTDKLNVTLNRITPETKELTKYYLTHGVELTETFEPALVRNAVIYHFLTKAVRDSGFKFCLSGEGADEVFGGYDYFKRLPVKKRDDAIHLSLSQIHKTYLQMADRASMSTRIEVRVPYMDYKFILAASSLAPTMRIDNISDKVFLRSAFTKQLPESSTKRPKTGMNAGAGFGSNDPDEGVYFAAVKGYYKYSNTYNQDYEIALQKGRVFNINLNNCEEIYNFARFVELGYTRLVNNHHRPQLNTKELKL